MLGYINNDSRRFHVFVANRVAQIQRGSQQSQWRYVPSEANPADDASRGLLEENPSTDDRWFKGPSFLWRPDLPTEGDNWEVCADDPEVKTTAVVAATSTDTEVSTWTETVQRFSSWHRLLCVMTLCLRWWLKKQDRISPCSVEEILVTEKRILAQVQKQYFTNELEVLCALNVRTPETDRVPARQRNARIKEKSALYKLDPYLDEDNLIRVGGRISRSDYSPREVHPIVLPKASSCHISMLIIQHAHLSVCHQGRGMTVSRLRRSGYWIIGCISGVSSYLRSCVVCRRLYGNTETQKMAHLPKDRLQAEARLATVVLTTLVPGWYEMAGRM